MKKYPFAPRWWDFPSALLLLAAMLTSASRLVATDWTPDLSIVQTIAFFGVFAGLALGYSRFSGRTVGFVAFIYGLFLVPWQLALTTPPGFSWLERMVILINRLQTVISQLILREPVRDSLLFLVVMFILYWALSVHAGYTLTRRGDPWVTILPGGLALFVIHSFDPAIINRIWYLAAYLFFMLILIARLTFVHYQSHWRESRTALPPHISLDFIRYTILAVMVIVILAWTAPALARALPQANRAWQPVRSAWTKSINQFENAFASLKATVFTQTAVYSSTSSLGRGTELTDAQVFRVRVPLDLPATTRLYWRARAYDTYQNGQWRSTLDSVQPYNPESEELPVAPGISRWQGAFNIASYGNITTLFTPAQLLWISRQGKIEYAENPDGTIDLTTFLAEPFLGAGENYEILASLSAATIQELRDSGTDYPLYIRERYLQIPASITPRTRELAQEITAGLTNPYDQAVAITEYLRRNIQYVPFLEEAPPSNHEPVDWFLFESKTGFCNYYASAEVVLLRSLGIPARWVVGYAQGELLDDSISGFNSENFTYLVRQRDAHAWPEVYFSKYGWVEFEPTVSQPAIQRLDGAVENRPDPLTEEEELAALREDKREQLELLRNAGRDAESAAPAPEALGSNLNWLISLVAGMGLLVVSLRLLPVFGLAPAPVLIQALFIRVGIRPLAPLDRWAERAQNATPSRVIHLPPLPLLLERAFQKLGLRTPPFIQRWARQTELPPLIKAYLEINRSLVRAGKPPSLTDTPTERARVLGELLPLASLAANDLVTQYQASIFGQRAVDLDLAQRSAAEIRKHSWQAFARRWLEKFQRPDPAARLRTSRDGRSQ